jgi:regulator of protease activity HflC (stomatin/prohibitin superfamily)
MGSAGEVAIGVSVELILAAIALGVLYRFLGRFVSLPHRQDILSFQRGVLLHGERVEKVLSPGTYWIKPKRTLMLCDMRPKPFQVLAQELTTADRMSVRIGLVGEYRVAAPESFLVQSSDSFGALYLDMKQALRTAASELDSETFLSGASPLVMRIRELLVPRSQQLGIELVQLEISESVPIGWLETQE